MLSNDEKFEYELSNIGPGWHKIAIALDGVISEICPDYELVQIKSKLGGMRFYIDYSQIRNDEISRVVTELIGKAEALSRNLCENCGNRRADIVNSVNQFNYRCEECEVK